MSARIHTSLITPDLRKWGEQIKAANVLADAVAEYLKHTGNSPAERRQVVLAALNAYRQTVACLLQGSFPGRAGEAGMSARQIHAWAIEWHSRNLLDGENRSLMWDGEVLFRTRRECRTFIDARYGYIRQRPDLRAEPYGWYLPQAVRVVVRRSAR